MSKKALEFVKRDFLIMVSYKFSFVLEMLGIFIMVALFYFCSQFINKGSIKLLGQYGNDYFSFILIGAAFADYVSIGAKGFAGSIRDGQLTGTLEVMLLSPNRLPSLLLYSSLWSYLYTTLRIFLYISAGVIVFGFSLGEANIVSALIVFVLSMVCFISMGGLLASLFLVVKRGDAAVNLAGKIGFILSGLFFPIEVLPPWLLKISAILPMTYSLHGLRFSLLKGSTPLELSQDIIGLAVFCIVFLPLGVLSFRAAVRTAKINGSLTHY
jgi:ABC-2 type transport system permease protein